ncbi:TIR domain-containing protein [bacterium]|nr:TIR domain-containing protein [bacterium]
MKVFVSHSIEDQKLLAQIDQMLRPLGFQLLIAEHEISTSHSITQKIINMIEAAEFGLILMTKKAMSSGFVREEIGYMTAKNMQTLVVVEKGSENKISGFKFGHDYVVIDVKKPDGALHKVKEILARVWANRKETQRKTNLAIGIIAVSLLVMASD